MAAVEYVDKLDQEGVELCSGKKWRKWLEKQPGGNDGESG